MLLDRVRQDLARPTRPEIGEAAALLAAESGAAAVLFYGSVLRSENLDDVLDFYVLTPGGRGSPMRRAVSAAIWPDVGWREIEVGGRIIRAKVAIMPLATFHRAAAGRTLDTTIWARFAQPCALVWSAGARETWAVERAVAAAITTAARFAAVLGPRRGEPLAFWQALFDETYETEFRVERAGRSGEIVRHAPDHYVDLLPLAWAADRVRFSESGGLLEPRVELRDIQRLVAAWMIRRDWGKPLNILRLVKAAFTFDGATRYALYKIERHTGIRIAATPWRERHPLLAAPGVLWRVYRAQPMRKQPSRMQSKS